MSWHCSIITIIVILLMAECYCRCPNIELQSPCRCYSNVVTCYVGSHRRCDTCEEYSLDKSLKHLSDYTVASEKHFHRLVLLTHTGRNIQELKNHTTLDLTFDEIEIYSRDLVKIHSKAFAGTADRLKKFYVDPTVNVYVNAPAPYDSFDLINSFINADEIDFRPPKINQIPGRAFKRLTRLKRFLKFGYNFDQGTRLSIGDDAFYNLYFLKQLDLSSNQINRIPGQAMRFYNLGRNNSIHLNMSRNEIDDNTMATGWLNNINRRADVDLSRNQLTHLNQSAFSKFLNNGYSVRLGFNWLNCTDCRNKWLAVGQDKLKYKVIDAFCDGIDGGLTVFQGDYDHCKS